MCYYWRQSLFPVSPEGIASGGEIAVVVVAVQDYPGKLLHRSLRC